MSIRRAVSDMVKMVEIDENKRREMTPVSLQK